MNLFVIWELLEVIWKNEKISKFWQHHCQNSNKKYERGERTDVIVEVRQNLNFSNEVTEIPTAQIWLPR